MFIGETLTAENYTDPGDTTLKAHPSIVYTPWIPRGGDEGTFAMEVLALSWQELTSNTSLPELIMTVETKNSEQDDGAATPKGSVTAANTTAGSLGVKSVSATGCLELVRCKFELTDTAASIDIVARVYYAVFRCLNVSWSTN